MTRDCQTPNPTTDTDSRRRSRSSDENTPALTAATGFVPAQPSAGPTADDERTMALTHAWAPAISTSWRPPKYLADLGSQPVPEREPLLARELQGESVVEHQRRWVLSVKMPSDRGHQSRAARSRIEGRHAADCNNPCWLRADPTLPYRIAERTASECLFMLTRQFSRSFRKNLVAGRQRVRVIRRLIHDGCPPADMRHVV
jgi:hypothetical protein